jgi:hypothetical protein
MQRGAVWRAVEAAIVVFGPMLGLASAAADPGQPPTGATGALLSDVVRMVAAVEEVGWLVDKQAYAELEPVLLESVCRTPSSSRSEALSHLEAAAWRDPEQLFYASGGSLTDEVELALSARRRFVLLKRALARTSECPFWLPPSQTFTGRQTERDKWAIHAEGGGVLSLGRTGGELAFGGGGNGRLLLGRGFGDSFSLLGGGEVGGGAELNPPSDAEPFALKYTAAVPLVLRLRRVNWLYDFELAPTALLETEDTRISWGARVGFMLGLTTLRVRDFLPWAGVAVTAEHFVASGGREAGQVVRAGIRIGFRWLP